MHAARCKIAPCTLHSSHTLLACGITSSSARRSSDHPPRAFRMHPVAPFACGAPPATPGHSRQHHFHHHRRQVWPGMDVPEDVPQAQVEQVRATLPEEARDEPDDAMIRRFIRATGGNLTLVRRDLASVPLRFGWGSVGWPWNLIQPSPPLAGSNCHPHRRHNASAERLPRPPHTHPAVDPAPQHHPQVARQGAAGERGVHGLRAETQVSAYGGGVGGREGPGCGGGGAGLC